MKAFVTGGTGFIGSHLADRLIADSRYTEVRCLVRTREKWLADQPYIRIDGDLNNLDALRRGMDGADTLFHIAAIVKAPTRAEFQRANVDATEHLIRLAASAGVRKVIVLSSLAAAGPSNGIPLTESDPMRPVSMYGESKREMEEMVQNLAPHDLSITIIRPPVVYGPRENQIFTWFQMVNRGFCPIVGDGYDPKLSLVHVEDLIDGILLAASTSHQSVHTYFITGPEITHWNRIRELTCNILGKHPFTFYIRSGWVRRIATLVEKTASLAGIYPVLNQEKANEMILEWTCSGKKAERDLHFRPRITLEEGLRDTLDWYKSNNWL